MLKVTEVEKRMPSAAGLTKWARQDLKSAGTDFTIRRSQHVWSMTSEDQQLLMFGVYAPSLTSIPELWMLMYEGFSKRLKANSSFARDYIEDLLETYPRIQVRVADGNRHSTRFVEFLGFEYKRSVKGFNSRVFLIYEIIK